MIVTIKITSAQKENLFKKMLTDTHYCCVGSLQNYIEVEDPDVKQIVEELIIRRQEEWDAGEDSLTPSYCMLKKYDLPCRIPEKFQWKTLSKNLTIIEGDTLTYNGRRGGVGNYISTDLHSNTVLDYQSTEPKWLWWETRDDARCRLFLDPIEAQHGPIEILAKLDWSTLFRRGLTESQANYVQWWATHQENY